MMIQFTLAEGRDAFQLPSKARREWHTHTEIAKWETSKQRKLYGPNHVTQRELDSYSSYFFGISVELYFLLLG